ncbi:MAG TPA: hypothetical protein VE344_10890 [Methylomirabilota bacterium]|nr:hypothetical protein [Methylomirabilota bacterium]
MKLIQMNGQLFLASIFCLLLVGCSKTNLQDKDSFHLTIDKLIDDGETQIAVLKIESPRAADLQFSYKGKNGDSSGSALLSPEINGTTTEGQILLSAAKVDCDTNWTKIQVVTKVSDAIHNGGATCTSTYPVRPVTKLENFFSIVAVNGTYKFFEPLTIASLGGKPITLVLTNAPN